MLWIIFDNTRNKHEQNQYNVLDFECKHINKRKTFKKLFNISKGLIAQIFLPESHGGKKVSTIQEFSSDDLMDARDPPLSSHNF